MKPYLKSYSAILATYLILFMLGEDKRGQFLLFGFIIMPPFFIFWAQVAINTILHYSFCARGAVAPFALPLMWASCILPLYIYCFHVTNNWNEPGLFSLLGLGILLPITVLSALTAAGYSLARMIEKNRKE